MDDKIKQILACPYCKTIVKFKSNEILCQNCKRKYPIVEGIPLMLSKEHYEYWKKHFEDNVLLEGKTPKACDHWKGNFQLIQSNVLKWIDAESNLLILDVGCGSGSFSEPIAKNNNVIGIDFSTNMLRLAVEKQIYAIQAEASSLPFLSKSFDMVLCIEVLQYIQNCRDLLMELARVLKNRGQLILSFPNATSIIRIVNRRISKLLNPKKISTKLYTFTEVNKSGLTVGLNNISVVSTYYPFPMQSISFGYISFIEHYFGSNFIIKGRKAQ